MHTMRRRSVRGKGTEDAGDAGGVGAQAERKSRGAKNLERERCRPSIGAREHACTSVIRRGG
jgi:hypothetical protein